MRNLGRALFLCLLASAGLLAVASVAAADDDFESEIREEGSASTGDSIAGQTVAVTSAGQTRLDATNRSRAIRADTGDASAAPTEEEVAAEGKRQSELETAQVGEFDDLDDDDDTAIAEVMSGDALGGQVIGITTGPVGVADVVGANTSEFIDLETGDAAGVSDAIAWTGDAVGGQVMGILAGGFTSVDATNLSRWVDVLTGEALATNVGTAITGDGIGGQILGVITTPTGTADVVDSNTSRRIDLETGDATALNFSGFFALVLIRRPRKALRRPAT